MTWVCEGDIPVCLHGSNIWCWWLAASLNSSAGGREFKMIKPAVTSVSGNLHVSGNLDVFQTVKTCKDLQEQNNCLGWYCKGIFAWTWKNCCVCLDVLWVLLEWWCVNRTQLARSSFMILKTMYVSNAFFFFLLQLPLLFMLRIQLAC